MPVTVIVGGQFGSEGKGKVALHAARKLAAAFVVRVGGPNSGHTGVDDQGKTRVFRQLPASCLATNVTVILPAGSLIDPDLLKSEIDTLGLEPDRLIIDSQATVVSSAHRLAEAGSGLIKSIGSTGSGTGYALRERLARDSAHRLAKNDEFLSRFTQPFVSSILRTALEKKARIVVEGTQGFGLSLWHGGNYPFATSRDTSAAGFISEAGLSPFDVDDITLVLRAFPIRVGGNSGPLENEISWSELAQEARLPLDFVELTSATKRVRRVARFDAEVVKKAIAVNCPTNIVLNHLDYVDPDASEKDISPKILRFIAKVEKSINSNVNFLGFSSTSVFPFTSLFRKEPNHANRS